MGGVMKTVGVMATLAMATTGMNPRLPGPGPFGLGALGLTSASGAVTTSKSASSAAGSPKKMPAANKEQDTLLMDTKLKIVEILEVRFYM